MCRLSVLCLCHSAPHACLMTLIYRACFSPLLLSPYVNYSSVPVCGPQVVHRRGGELRVCQFVCMVVWMWTSSMSLCPSVFRRLGGALLKKLAGLWAPHLSSLWDAALNMTSRWRPLFTYPLLLWNHQTKRSCLQEFALRGMFAFDYVPSATWHQADLQVLHVLLIWMWRYVLVVFKPLNDLYILTCLSCHAECVLVVIVFLISLRQSLNWTNALWTAFGTSECCTEYTDWRLNGVCMC